MQAITVIPGRTDSARLQEVDEPPVGEGAVLARIIGLGVCGTDHEILHGTYGWAPEGRERLVLGHESLARVLEAPADSGLRRDDLVVGIVRRPDPRPCENCAAGEWDMCSNGLYTERGIKRRDGYAAERIRIEPEFAVRVPQALGLQGVLVEPASVVAKAWEQIERIGARVHVWNPRTVLVTGAGPIGLLAALMGRQRQLEVHVYDRVEQGPKPELVAALGARYHAPDLAALDGLAPDIVIECTGASAVVLDVLGRTAANGVVCLSGVSSGGRQIQLDLSMLNRSMVLENDLVFGTVNANRRHYEAAVEALAAADPRWLSRLITRRIALNDWREAFVRRPDDIKVVIDFAG